MGFMLYLLKSFHEHSTIFDMIKMDLSFVPIEIQHVLSNACFYLLEVDTLK